MSPLKVDIVTAERSVYSGEADMVIAPGVQGQLGILPHHIPLMTVLGPGELRLKKGDEEISLAVSGGFLEVRPDSVVVLADTAERVEEIDRARAEEARERARKRLAARSREEVDAARAEMALRRALIRLSVVDKARRRKKRS